ncbi:hypothetical protein AGABI2DRAFT_221786 [Agaricus bisporus var. bisporus H97]|uniref:hypothetical protein n=1 Tax=Agaricus bisporus var. bisporus (strain H97 / ATCC MYA-4626 / FGSC 10389) TaxID=936046 RepID=UPI00029F6192|nr:hypothetical protein AGABI2DRAFT_221786 [Agaricus bisporus var. bisporus H97]EKV47547.1 hypothetical protein AGABI2DRAFT_221786 [Agaricus bisporus var. bisporus H97]
MPDTRKIVLAVTTTAVVLGTAYSVVYNTYLDTSDPALTHAPHPLTNTHYFANKSNPLNVFFTKKAWGWTTGLFFFSWVSSPPQTRTARRVLQWLLATTVWILLTMWFFGPSLLDRLIVASGGSCIFHLPSGDYLTLPADACFTKALVSPSSNPELFSELAADLAPLSLDWKALPRLRRGHDVSGHIFLLTLSTLFLADQLRPSLSLPTWPLIHKFALIGNVLLIAIWILASATTAVYFHSPLEKVTGYLLGVTGFLLTQLVPGSQTTLADEDQKRAHSH